MASEPTAPADTTMVRKVARRYRRRKERCRGEARPRRRVQQRGSVAITTSADIDAVWDVVRDITRVGEWSHECVSAAWLDGARSAAPGVRFRGRNRARVFRWGRICEVVAVDPYQFVWRTVPSMLYPDSCEWRITLDNGDDGTVIAQSFEAIRAPKVHLLLYALIIPAHRDRTTALIDDLHRLGHLAHRSTPGDHDVPASTV